MKINRWFKALVLGGATLGAAACGAKSAIPPSSTGSSAGDTVVAVDSNQEKDTSAGQDAAKAAMDILAAIDAANAADTAAKTADTATSAADTATSAADTATSAADTATSAADTATSAADTATSAADTAALKCSATPTPSDACGCPCCWATGFLNTSPECKSFCGLGDGGKGCCA